MLHNSDLNHQENSEKNQSSSQKAFFLPMNNVIPTVLLEEKNVRPIHLKLYALINNLSDKYGYCFASNRRFALTLNCTERYVRIILKWLEDRGYIERREEGNEFSPERHIYIADFRQKKITRGGNWQFLGGGTSSSPKEEELNKKKKKNTKKKDETPANAVALANLFLKKIKERKPNFTKFITALWYTAMTKLLSLRSEKEIVAVMDYAFKDNFYSKLILEPAKLLKHLDALEMQMQNPTKASSDVTQENRAWIKNLEKQISSHPDIQITAEGIVFCGGQSQYFVKLNDANFKNLVITRLKLMKIKIK